MLPKTGAFLWDLVRRMGGSTEDGASPAYAENEKASIRAFPDQLFTLDWLK
jgi:hypothetical protein